ncbi:hypothetical protein D3C81_1610140 [compost metagenome]
MDEDLYINPSAILVQGVGDHLADRDLAEIHRGADVQRAQVLGVQGEMLAGLAVGDGGWVFKPGEMFDAGVRLANVGTDVIAREQGVYARYTTGTDARPHHPELGVLTGKAFSLLVEFYGGVDVLLVVTERHLGNVADHDVAIAHFGFVGCKPGTGLEGEGDGRAFLHEVVHHQREADKYRHDRHDPHQ